MKQQLNLALTLKNNKAVSEQPRARKINVQVHSKMHKPSIAVDSRFIAQKLNEKMCNIDGKN